MKTSRKSAVLCLCAFALLFLLLGLTWLSPRSSPTPLVKLTVSPQTSNSIAGNFRSFVVTNGTSRQIDCGIVDISIKLNGEWQPWQHTTVDAEACNPGSTNRFRITPPELGEAWRVRIFYIPIVNNYEVELHTLDRKLNSKLFEKLDRRKLDEAVSEEIGR